MQLLIDISIDDLTNDESKGVFQEIRSAVRSIYPNANVEINDSTEYDDEDEEDEDFDAANETIKRDSRED